jgi:hypothetical protein
MLCVSKEKGWSPMSPRRSPKRSRFGLSLLKDGLRPQAPESGPARLPSTGGTIHHKTVRCKFFCRRACVEGLAARRGPLGRTTDRGKPRKGRQMVAQDVSPGNRTPRDPPFSFLFQPRKGRQNAYGFVSPLAGLNGKKGERDFGALTFPGLTSWATFCRAFGTQSPPLHGIALGGNSKALAEFSRKGRKPA